MVPIRYTKSLFLRAICVVYLFAFVSFYIQIPGLYGDNGVLPARNLLENSKHKTLSAKVHYQPTLLWLAPYLGLDTAYAMDVLTLLGAFLAFTGFVSQKFCTIPLFAGLWSLYFSLVQVGQVFVTSQWDDLLLEVGLICLLLAPVLPGRRKTAPSDAINFWLVRWLLFRFLFTSGFVKLHSGCPKWWDLTALKYHFETMVLPTPLSWYAHYLPMWILKLSAIFANVCEIILPFFFFIPIRRVRITAFVFEMFLQIAIVLTGNFNFLNLLLVTLLVSLLDDQFFIKSKKFKSIPTIKIISFILNFVIYGALTYAIVCLFNVKFNGQIIESKIGFNKEQYDTALRQAILFASYAGLLSLVLTILKSLVVVAQEYSGVATTLFGYLTTVFYGAIALLLFVGSTVPMQSLHKATNSSVEKDYRLIYNRLHKLHAVNDYVIFTKMPETRVEIIFEGANSVEGPWNEISFLYKPGNLNHSLPFVAPYSPRLDWQLYFVAQARAEKEPFFLSLVHRLLEGRSEVKQLLSPNNNSPPKYIKTTLYTYKYTPADTTGNSWWTRTKLDDFTPVYSKDSPGLVEFLKARNLIPSAKGKITVHPVWKQILDGIRYVANNLEASLLLWSIFTAGCAVITTTNKMK